MTQQEVALARAVLDTARRLKAVGVNIRPDDCAIERIALAKAVLAATDELVTDL